MKCIRHLSLFFLTLIFAFATQNLVQAQSIYTLEPTDPTNIVNFGQQVAIDGRYAAATSSRRNSDDSFDISYLVNVFEREGDAWVQTARIEDPSSDDLSGFGRDIALSGNVLVVGSSRENSDAGAAYVYRRNPSTGVWEQEVRLTSPRPSSGQGFGDYVAVDGDRLIIGAGQSNGGTKGAAIYGYDGSAWQEEAWVANTSRVDYERTVDIKGDLAIVGYYQFGFSGEARIFERDANGNWFQRARILDPEPNDGVEFSRDSFGTSVAINGDYVFVGALLDDDRGRNSGAVHVYRRDFNSWTLIDKVRGRGAGEALGNGVAMADRLAIIGTFDGDGQDRVDLMRLDAPNQRWRLLADLDDPNLQNESTSNDSFGPDVDIDETGQVIVRASRHADTGVAYIFSVTPPVSNLRASDEAEPRSIDLSWSVPSGNDPDLDPDGFRVYRNGSLVTELNANAQTYSDNDEVYPGAVHTYCVASYNDYGESASVCDVGRAQANGRIGGRVSTPTGGAVNGVALCVDPLGSALEFSNGGSARSRNVEAFPQDALTAELWVKADAGNAGTLLSYRSTGDLDFQLSNPSNLNVTIAGQSTGATGVNVADGNWHHLALTWQRSDGRLHLLRDGLRVVERTVATGQSLGADGTVALGRALAEGNGFDDGAGFQGGLDEVRIWSTARTDSAVTADVGRLVPEGQENLALYWRFDSGQGDLAYDFTAGESTTEAVLTLENTSWTSDMAPVEHCGVTGNNVPQDGDFAIRKVVYENGREFVVIPDTTGGHRFDPERSNPFTLTPTDFIATGLAFTDTATVSISGTVLFAGTTCANVEAEILIDDIPMGTVAADGTFLIGGVQAGTHIIKPRFTVGEVGELEHEFSPAQIEIEVTGAVENLVFENIQTHRLEGRVVGGDCGLPLGTTSVTVTGPNACMSQTVDGSDTGAYSLELPALDGLIVEAQVPNDPFVEFEAREVALEIGDRTEDFIYRSRPEITVFGLPDPPGSCGVPVIEQLDTYDMEIGVVERYQDQTCAVDSGYVVVRNDLADAAAPDTLDLEDGNAFFTFRTGTPNIVGGGSRPYQKRLGIEVVTGGGPEAGRNGYSETADQWAIVEGNRPREQTFATVSPEIPMAILHDPPGDRSYSFMEDGMQICGAFGVSFLQQSSLTAWQAARVGARFETEVGTPFWSQSFETQSWGEIRGSLTVGASVQGQAEFETCVGATERFQTSDSDLVTGDDGDVFIGAAMNMLYALTDVLEYDESTCRADLSQDIIFGTDGFATEYIYTEGFIRENLIPRLQQLRDLPATPPDSVRSLENQVRVWEQTLALNERAKRQVAGQQPIENRSFDGNAGGFTFTETLTASEKAFVEFNLFVEAEVATEAGFEVAGSGASGGVSVRSRTEVGAFASASTLTESTTGYVLDDDDPGDFFSVNIKSDPQYGTPLFELVSGESSCLWEEGTLPRDVVQLTADQDVVSDVDPNSPATFTLSIGNPAQSQTDPVRQYFVAPLQESNPDGAVLRLNGDAFSNGQRFTVPAREAVQAQLTVARGTEAFTYNDLQLVVYPECEYQAWQSGLPLQIVDTLNVSVRYSNPCSDVTIVEPQNNWLVNAGSNNTLRVALSGYDKNLLTAIKLEIAPVGTSSWQPLSIVSVGDLPNGQATLDLDVSALDDGEYNLRVGVQCSAGTSYAPVRRGVIDRAAPAAFGSPEPTDGVLRPGGDVRVTFEEELDPSSVSTSTITLRNVRSGDAVPVSVQYSDRQIVLTPGGPVEAIENEVLEAVVDGVQDQNGNAQTEPVTWRFRVNQNPVGWLPARIAEARTKGDTEPIFATITNRSLDPADFTLVDLPSWVQATPTSGTVQPESEQRIQFTPNVGLAPGVYTATLQATTPQGPEPLQLELTLQADPPTWSVSAADYTHEMNVTAAFYVDDVSFAGPNDRVAAYVGGELRGTAVVQEVVPQDEYAAFLTVYSNQSSGETVSFRLWDASEDNERLIGTTRAFVADTAYGSAAELDRLVVSGAVLQSVPLADGWTWMSLGVETQNMATGTVLNRLAPNEGDVIVGQTGFSQYVAGTGWIGSLDTLQAGALYKMRLAESQPLDFVGEPIAGSDRPLDLESGWNWIGYLPDNPLLVGQALASLNVSSGDLLRSQTASASYNGAAWQGTLQEMEPGAGYLLRASNDGILTYPGASGVVQSLHPQVPSENLLAPDWSVDPSAFEHTMTVTLTLDGAVEGMRLAAFKDGEVRGVADPVFMLDQWLYFLTLYSNEPNEVMSFRFYNPDRDTEQSLQKFITFNAEQALGTPREPFAFPLPTSTEFEGGPITFGLEQNYPNPFAHSTTLQYGLEQPVRVQIEVYDVQGRRVRTLVDAEQPAGRHTVEFDARDLASGMYLYRIQAGSFTATRRMTVVR